MLEIQKRLSNSFYALLSLPATAMGFALSVQISALSWILSTKYNLNIHEVGFVWAAGPLAGIFGQVIIGVISDKVWIWNGRRRPFILVGGTLAALMLLCLPNLDKIADGLGVGSIMGVALFVALTLDLAINISFNPTRSIIADVTPDGIPRTRGYTWMQTISGFFGVLAYVIGATYGNYFLIYSSVILVLLFSIVPTLFIMEPRTLGGAAEEKDGHASAAAVNRNELMKIYLAHAFTWLGVQTMFVFIFAYISQMQFGSLDPSEFNQAQSDSIGRIIAIAFAVLNTVGFLLPAFVLEPIADRIGRVKTHTACIAIMALAYMGIVLFGKSPIALYVLIGFVGIGWAATVSLPFAIFSEKVDKQKMGYYMGIFNLSVVIPQLVVSFAIGLWISGVEDKTIIFQICFASLAISAILWLFVKENRSLNA